MKKICYALLAVLFFVLACSPQDPNIKKQYDLWLTDKLTGEKIPDTEIEFTIYKNGSYACGRQVFEAENIGGAKKKCWDMLAERQIAKAFLK